MKTAVIGLGRMGRRHLQNVAALGLELAGICDSRLETLEAVRQELALDAGRCYQDGTKLLRTLRPELVIVATTAPTHADLTCSAASAGALFVLCEKPMAVSLAQCDRMIETCDRHQTLLAINHPMRYMDRFVEVKALVTSADFGELESVVTAGANIGLAMNGTHRFEAFYNLTGEPPASVTAWLATERLPNPRGAEFEDRAGAVHVNTPKGKRLHLDLGAQQGHGLTSIYSCRYGQVIVDDLDGTLSWNVRQPEYRERPTAQYLNPARQGRRQIQAADSTSPARAVLDALLRKDNFPTGPDGRLAVATLVAAYVSDEQGHVPLAVDDRLPSDRMFPWA